MTEILLFVVCVVSSVSPVILALTVLIHILGNYLLPPTCLRELVLLKQSTVLLAEDIPCVSAPKSTTVVRGFCMQLSSDTDTKFVFCCFSYFSFWGKMKNYAYSISYIFC